MKIVIYANYIGTLRCRRLAAFDDHDGSSSSFVVPEPGMGVTLNWRKVKDQNNDHGGKNSNVPIELNIRLDGPRITSPKLWVITLADGLLYAFIGPFTVLYVMTRFFMAIPSFESPPGFGIQTVCYGGMALMWLGGLWALVCTLYMVIGLKGTPLVTMPTKKILAKGPYAYVRNPMMLSLLFILLGEALYYAHSLLFVWLICWARMGHLIIVNYEEPQLERRFGEEWKAYCRKVPRWVPRINSGRIK